MPQLGDHLELAPAGANPQANDVAQMPRLGPVTFTGQGWQPLEPNAECALHEWSDFAASPTATAPPSPWAGVASSGSMSYLASATDPLGVARLSTGSSATGRYAICNDVATARLFNATGIEWWFWSRVRLAALSSGTNTFGAHFGFQNVVTGLPASGAALSHQNGVGNWQFRVGTTTGSNVDTGVPVVAGQWVNCAIRMAGGAAVLYLSTGGNALPTSGVATTSVPTTTGFMAAASLVSSASINAKTADVDYLGFAALASGGRV